MNDTDKTREELFAELSALRQRIAQWERAQVEEERFTCAFMSNTVPIAITTIEEGRYVEVNGAALEFIGLERDQVIGHTSTGIGFITREQRSLLLQEYARKGRIDNIELQIKGKNGELRRGLFNSSGIRLGDRDHLLTVMTDITECRQIERSLKISQEILGKVVANVPDMILLTDLEGRIIFINEQGAQMGGYDDPQELIGQDVFLFVSPEIRESTRQNMQMRVEGRHERFGPQEFEVATKDGRQVFIETNGEILSNADGSPYGTVHIGRDVTGRKRLERERQITLEELETLVQKRTTEIKEANTALRVLLDHREEDQRHIEERLQLNVNELVMPLIHALRTEGLSERSLNCLAVLEANLKDITDPFLSSLSVAYRSLTPKEIQIAGMIREGKNTKEISEILGISRLTVETHRNKMRSKLGLVNGKTNLRSFLLAAK